MAAGRAERPSLIPDPSRNPEPSVFLPVDRGTRNCGTRYLDSAGPDRRRVPSRLRSFWRGGGEGVGVRGSPDCGKPEHWVYQRLAGGRKGGGLPDVTRGFGQGAPGGGGGPSCPGRGRVDPFGCRQSDSWACLSHIPSISGRERCRDGPRRGFWGSAPSRGDSNLCVGCSGRPLAIFFRRSYRGLWSFPGGSGGLVERLEV